MSSLTVIIPTLNEERYLPIALRSLAAQRNCQLEVIVVDGKSEDKTVAEAMRNASELGGENFAVKVMVAEKRNISFQRNLGAKAASHRLLLFLDADSAMPGRDTLARMIGQFEKGGLSVAGCRLKSLEHVWLADLYYFIFFLFTRAMRFLKPYASGACLMTSAEAFKKAGGFDETIFINEDGDYCRRVKKFGKFAILRPAIYTSCRRFDRMGYLKAGLMYVRIAIARIIHGELRDPRKFHYRFGDFDKEDENLKTKKLEN